MHNVQRETMIFQKIYSQITIANYIFTDTVPLMHSKRNDLLGEFSIVIHRPDRWEII
jgi:hypothetical protein